ncbi:MAG TPA: superoxide dismutase [Ilumatobacteraceae bacterium]|nr:superoxide dismutase [Ilumatobacteraceae bacterium]
MSIELPALPYATDALAPHLSPEVFEYHHGKHHATYVKTVNELIAGTELEHASLDDIVLRSEGKLFNNAAQVWNHNLYWRSMTPGGGGAPIGRVADAIDKSFGSFDAFRAQFHAAAVGQFGSGWAWLTLDAGRLAIEATSNADLPLRHGRTAVLVCDVWEHAYYIDYRNRRPDYVAAFLDHLVNWSLVEAAL